MVAEGKTSDNPGNDISSSSSSPIPGDQLPDDQDDSSQPSGVSIPEATSTSSNNNPIIYETPQIARTDNFDTVLMPKSDESELSINDISSLPVQGPMTAQGARISQPSLEEQIQNTVNDKVFAILRGMKIDPAMF